MAMAARLLSLLALLMQAPAWGQLCSGVGNIQSATNGLWSRPSTWIQGQVPTSSDEVCIDRIVTVDITTATAQGLNVYGTLSFSRITHSNLTMVTADINANSGGIIDMGTTASPIPNGITATLVLATGSRAQRYGLNIAPGGRFTSYGSTKTYSTNLAQDVLAGTTSILVANPGLQGWQVGDMITIGMSTLGSTDLTERRTITSLAGGDPLNVGISPPLSYFHPVESTHVANLTRNVLVRSSGTNVAQDTSYINSSTNDSDDFNAVNTEFAYLGGGGNAGIRISSGHATNCAFRDGVGMDAVNVTLDSNLVYNNQGNGIQIYGASSLNNNQVYSNKINGIVVNNPFVLLSYNSVYANANTGIEINASSNTLINNYVYSQLDGNGFTVSAPGNLFFSNYSYRNSGNSFNGYGIAFYTNGTNNVLIRDRTFSNKAVGLAQSGVGINNTAVEASLGFNLAGNSAPDGGDLNPAPEIDFSGSPSASEHLVLKDVLINPLGGGVNTAAFGPNNSMISYNQDGLRGRIQVWGNYVVSGSTLTLDYAAQLYASTATATKLMFGRGHSASVVSTDDNNSLSQIISITYDTVTPQWRVDGSSSGFLGTFTSPITNQPFPPLSPQFYLTFAPGNSPSPGDRVDFALIAASKDANRQKNLFFGSADFSFNGGKSKLTVTPTGGLKLVGLPTAPTMVNQILGNNFYTLVDSGAFTMIHSTMQNTDPGGLRLSGNAGVFLASSTFDRIGIGASTSSYITLANLSSNATFYNVSFNLSRSTSGIPFAYNVLVQQPISRLDRPDSGIKWLFRNYTGPFSGPDYEYDPNGRIDWADPRPNVTATSPGAGSLCAPPANPIRITFDTDMDPNTLGSAFTVKAIQDNFGNTMDQLISGATSYASNQLTFSGNMAHNTLYQVTLTNQAKSALGLPLAQTLSFQFRTLMNRNAFNGIKDNTSGISVTLPAGTLAADGSLQTSVTNISPNLATANQKLISNSGDPRRYPIPGTVIDLKALDSSCQNSQNTFPIPVTVLIPYQDTNNDGTVDGTSILSDTLKIWWLDDNNKVWVQLTSSVDNVRKQVRAQTDHFTTFAAIGQSAVDLSNAYAFPVPFKPSSGHTNITFINVGQTSTIRIYTIRGELVRELSSGISGTAVWDVTNSQGERVASGGYLYVIDSGADTKTGKLAIIR